jgi:hypothetical protein
MIRGEETISYGGGCQVRNSALSVGTLRCL